MSDLTAAFNQYLQSIGMFITQFANVESHVRRLVQLHSGLDAKRFEALIGLPRSSEAVSKLEKLATADLSDDADALSAVRDAFSQLKHTTKLRDWIVHYGGNPIETGQILVRLRPTEFSAATGENYHLFDQQELNNAILDAGLAKRILLYRLDRSMPPEFRAQYAINAIRKKPWRYKPPQLRRNPK